MRWVWFAALSALLALELWAIGNVQEGDTLTEAVVPLLEHPAVWAATLLAWVAFASWLVVHWWWHPSRRDNR